MLRGSVKKKRPVAFQLSTLRNMICCVRLQGTYIVLAQIRRNRELWVRKEIYIVDWASGLSGTFPEQSGFDNCTYSTGGLGHCTIVCYNRVPAVSF